jgi:ABC-2 type transport system permease protein
VLTVEEEAELEGFRQSVPGMGSMFVMLTVLAGAGLLVEERKRRTLERVLASPTRRSEVIFGKILGRFVMGLAQFGVAVLTGVVLGRLFGVGFGSSPVIFLVVMGAFVFFASALTLFLATLAENSTQASAFSTLVAVTLAPLGGAWWSLDLEFIPEIMRALARVSPFYWAMQGFRAAILNAGWPPALPGVLVLLAAGLVFFVIASLRLGRKLGER